MLEKIRLFSGNANIALARKICENLGVALGQANVSTFSDGETRVEINENVRGMDVFIIQSTCSPVNVTLMELLIMIDAMKRASAERITAVVPLLWLWPSRQESSPASANFSKISG